MIFCTTEFRVPYQNFAAEYYLATEKDLGDDIFMLWRNEPSVIVGRFQNTYEEVNIDYCRTKGIHIARRMSGGGTVYHDLGCWEFTFISHDGSPEIDFSGFMKPIAELLSGLGLKVRISGRNDITLVAEEAGYEREYKISGNTQYKKSGITVHHGTLLFDTDINELVNSTTPKDYKIRSKAIKSVRDRVTNIRHHLPEDMTSDDFGRYIASHMGGSEYRLNDHDLTRISELEPMFSADSWIFGENPRFELKRTICYPLGSVEVGLTVRHGKITEAAITGDFFSAGDTSTDTQPGRRLVGAQFSPDAVRSALADINGVIAGISADDIVSGIFGPDRPELSDLRQQIHEVDTELTGLLARRMAVSARIGAYKKEHGMPVSDPAREAEVMEYLKSISSAELKPYIGDIYQAVFDASKKIQSEIISEKENKTSD